jgi:hypothetical protein
VPEAGDSLVVGPRAVGCATLRRPLPTVVPNWKVTLVITVSTLKPLKPSMKVAVP